MSYFAGKVKKLQSAISLWREPRWHLRTMASASQRSLRRHFQKAKQQGYQDGFLVEGGAFALSGAWLSATQREGIFDQASDFLSAPVTEDIIMTMLTYRLGLRAINSSLFCIEPGGLGYPIQQMISQAALAPIIHSVKHDDNLIEKQQREAFRVAGFLP